MVCGNGLKLDTLKSFAHHPMQERERSNRIDAWEQ